MSISKWRYTEECNGRPCPGDCDHCSFEPGDLISRADAIDAVVSWTVEDRPHEVMPTDLVDRIKALPSAEAVGVCKAHEEEHLNIVNRIKELQYAIAKTQTVIGKMVESAEAEPTVIRSKTLMPTKDFMEWANRIKEVNPNAVVLPCDAEVASADAVQGEWIKWTETKEDDTGVTYIPHWKCSVCDTEYDPYFANRINVCPNCGARMIREDCGK